MAKVTGISRSAKLWRSWVVLGLGFGLCASLAGTAVAGAVVSDRGADEKTSLVSVAVPSDAAVDRLLALGLDAAIYDADEGRVELVLHGSEDVAALAGTGYPTEVIHEDLAAVNEAHRQEEAAVQALLDDQPALASGLPTGRVSYRTLPETNAEMAEIAQLYPDRAKLIELSEPSLLAKTIYGLEVSHNVHEDVGKPVYVVTGVHHAREWPTVEYTMELVWDLLLNDGIDPRITSLLERGKLIAVPMMNVDGYDVSRRNVNNLEQKRKNCRFTPGVIPTQQQCEAPGTVNQGVDPNRNYPAFWGGAGSSTNLTASNYRGAAPLSEPEARAMLDLWSSHQVTVANNNHTAAGAMVRLPASNNEPVMADFDLYDEVVRLMGAPGWRTGSWPETMSQATGVAEQSAYYVMGTLAFTPELTNGFSGTDTWHPPYQAVIDNYLGLGQFTGRSVRNPLLVAFDVAVDPSAHSVIKGKGAPGATLTASKDVVIDSTLLVSGSPIPTRISIETTMTVPENGQFEWHLNPSTRPSQYASSHLEESWTLSCPGRSGQVIHEVDVTVARGEQAEIDMRRCPAVPQRPTQAITAPQ